MGERAFCPGQQVLLCMPLTGTRGQRNVYATVVHCRHEEMGFFNVEMEFDVLDLLIPKAPAVAAVEQLVCQVRIPDGATKDDIGNVVLELVSDADGLDRALGGHGLKIENLQIFGDMPVREGAMP